MAKETIANKSLCDIHYLVTLDLIRNMDCDDGWVDLASRFGYTAQQIFRLKGMRYKPNGSPTDTLLWELGCEGYKVRDLYEKLKLIRRLRETEILEEYVRKNKEPPLGVCGARACHNPTIKKTEEDISSKAEIQDLDTLLRQVKIPDAADALSHDSGSAVNYNYPLHQAQCRKDVKPDTKSNYEKYIPWTDKLAGGSDATVNGSGFASFKSGNSSVSHKQRQQASESDDPPSNSAAQLSGFGDSCLPYSNTSPSMCSGADNLLNMLMGQGSQASTKSSDSLPCASVNSPDLESVTHKPLFSLKEICEATENFNENNILGQGAFGTVYRGNLRSIECAIKLLNSSEVAQGTDMKKFLSELCMLKEFSHENIVVLYGYALGDKQLCLVYQHLINGSLEDRLLLKKGTPALTWQRRLNILLGACRGLNVLHTFRDKPLIHGDIKSANILLDHNWEAKIADLGQAAYATGISQDTKGFTHVSVVQTGTKVFGTKAYHAPEVLKSNQLSVKSDVYAMGVVFLEVCSGQGAYDPNRGADAFLVRTFCDLEEDQWLTFQDKHLNTIPLCSLTSVLTVANSCVQESKKRRPIAKSLLEKVERCFNQYLELSSTGNVDTYHPCPPRVHQQDIEELRKKLGNMWTDNSLPSINSSMNDPLVATKQDSILLRDENSTVRQPQEISQNTVQQSVNSFQSQRDEIITSMPSKIPIPEEVGKSLPNDCNNSQSSKFSSMISEDTNVSLEVLYGDSLAIRLQRAVDDFAARKELLKQGGVKDSESLDFKLLSQEMEDIKKQWLTENAEPQRVRLQQKDDNPSVLPVEDDSFPKADPKKLLELYAFDQQNFTSSSSDAGPAVFQCDPKKLAYMQQFDTASESGNNQLTSAVNQNEQKALLHSQNNLPQINSSHSHLLPLHNAFPKPVVHNSSPSYSSHLYNPYPNPAVHNSSLTYSSLFQNTLPNPAVYAYSQNPATLSHEIPQQSMNFQENTPNSAIEANDLSNYSYADMRTGYVYHQRPSGMGGNPRDHTMSSAYNFVVQQDSQQILEKQSKKSELDDLMAEVMSEESLGLDG